MRQVQSKNNHTNLKSQIFLTLRLEIILIRRCVINVIKFFYLFLYEWFLVVDCLAEFYHLLISTNLEYKNNIVVFNINKQTL